MRSYEKNALDTFNVMWRTWESPTQESVEQSISTWDDDCKGFGSGITEIWRSKEDFRKYCEDSFNYSPQGFKVETKWIETEYLGYRMVSLWGEISIIVELPQKKIVIDPIRVTGLLKEVNGEMKLIQWHASTPDISTEEELWEGMGKPKYYGEVSILFTDFVGFGKQVAAITPQELVDELNEIFAGFDAITKRNGLEKIKTIGDAYMAAIGFNSESHHAASAIRTAKQFLNFLSSRNEFKPIKWDMRIGIHSGPAVGGTIGTEKLGFDLWGDTVNLASRVEGASKSNRINISSDTYELVKDFYDCEYRGKIQVKDGRMVPMYFVL